VTHLVNRGTDCPKTLLASHFHQIFSLTDHPIPRSSLNLAHMSLLALPRPGRDDDDLVFTFQLRSGLLESSYAAQCAQLHGIDPAVCQRAVQLTRIFEAGGVPDADVLELDEGERANLAKAETLVRRFVEASFEEDAMARLRALFPVD
jgi:DNA mismatch repair protein MSH5